MSYSVIGGFPSQQLSFRKKNKEWRRRCVDFGDDHSQLRYNLARKSVRAMQVNYDLLHGKLHMEELKKTGDVTVETLMDLFDGCPLVTDDNRELEERGFKAYLDDDYIVCCHLLIPQVEAMVRRLIYLNGGEVIHQGEDPAAGNLYISLDSLLDSEVAKAVMKEDMITYFKVLFVSPAGWNLRNLFCHGLLTTGSFNSTVADRVVHAIMVLSQFKERNYAGK